MQRRVTGLKAVLLGAAVLVGSTAGMAGAEAKSHKGHGAGPVTASRAGAALFAASYGSKHGRIGGHGRKVAWLRGGGGGGYEAADVEGVPSAELGSYGGMSCVPFARANSNIELAGNASAWWGAASGVYERGSRPEVGSVLNFRANGRMHSGHVAVVSNVENARVVDIDHANWSGRGAVTRNVRVVDVSPFNDWSAVRVALGRSGGFGSVYPTFGFIYDRPDHGVMVANAGSAPMPALGGAAPVDLRPVAERLDAAGGDEPVEVAEATVRGSYRHYGRFAGGHVSGGRASGGRQELIHRVKAGRSFAAAAEPRGRGASVRTAAVRMPVAGGHGTGRKHGRG